MYNLTQHAAVPAAAAAADVRACCVFRKPAFNSGLARWNGANFNPLSRCKKQLPATSFTYEVRCQAKKDVQGILETATNSAEVDEAYVKGGEYLRTIGMKNQAEIARVLDIAMNPNTLFTSLRNPKRAHNANARRLSVEDDMKPVVDFLSTSGLTRDEIVQVIKLHPPVLSYNVEARLKPLLSYLDSIGMENPMNALADRPSLFGLDVDKNLKKIVDYLQNNDFSQEQIVEMLADSI